MTTTPTSPTRSTSTTLAAPSLVGSVGVIALHACTLPEGMCAIASAALEAVLRRQACAVVLDDVVATGDAHQRIVRFIFI